MVLYGQKVVNTKNPLHLKPLRPPTHAQGRTKSQDHIFITPTTLKRPKGQLNGSRVAHTQKDQEYGAKNINFEHKRYLMIGS